MGNNGMIATEDIEIDDVVVFIPDEMLMTLDIVKQSRTVQFLYENDFID